LGAWLIALSKASVACTERSRSLIDSAKQMPNDVTPFIRLTGVTKRYGGVTALDNVDFACRRGTVHAVLGENGAGKSTLIKIMTGVARPNTGTILLDGQPVIFSTPAEATASGIVGVFQELSLVPDLSVAANICLTSPPGRWGFINLAAQQRRATALLARVGCEDVHPMELVRNLPLSRRQMVEIAKGLGRNAQCLVLDEATSALTRDDVKRIYDLVKMLRAEGLAIIYISHRMPEIAHLADVCTVFRNGRNVATFASGDLGHDQIVGLMIGRDYKHVFPPKPSRQIQPRPLLELEQVSWSGRIKNVSLSVGSGEIVGLGGLEGQGQRELLLALFGVLRGVTGSVRINGRRVRVTSPRNAKSKAVGIAFIPDDRNTDGLILPMSVGDNMSLAAIGQFVRTFLIDLVSESKNIQKQVKRMSIKPASVDVPVWTLSGGNQQKVLIGKWLMTDPLLLLLNDPTRGIDVGTKQEIYALMRELADSGTGILFYTTDYDELIGCCDRVAIFYEGLIRRELRGADITQYNIVAASLALPLEGDINREALEQ
jgi:ribose transport system ATP-binding protein